MTALAAVAKEHQRQNTSRLVLAITLLLIFIMAARSPLDSDLWWHLRAGEEALRAGRIVLTDTFSYTRLGAMWVNHSWLSQVILALLYRAGGFLSLGCLVALIATASMALVYAQMRGPALLRAFLLILAGIVAAPVWTPRPQLFSLLFISLTAWLLDCYHAGQEKRILWLLPLFVLWSNLHGGYPLGLMLIAADIVGQVYNRIFDSQEQSLSWRQIGRMVWIGAAAFLLTAVNPNGIQMWLIPFKTVNVGILQTLIQEWASPDFHDPVQQPFLALFLLAAAGLALSKKRASGVDVARFVLFGGLGLVARRNFGPFALVAAPVLVRALAGGFHEQLSAVLQSPTGLRIANFIRSLDQPSDPEQTGAQRLKRMINLLIIAVLGFTAAGKIYTVTHPAFLQQQIEQNYPAEAVQWLKTNHPQGRLFNAYNWGGYLLWSLPEYPVFVDGRTDLFGDDILTEWVTVVQAGEGWQQILNRWQVTLILLEPDRPVVMQLAAAGWNIILEGPGYILYGR